VSLSGPPRGTNSHMGLAVLVLQKVD
jgi:hypothetical protein